MQFTVAVIVSKLEMMFYKRLNKIKFSILIWTVTCFVDLKAQHPQRKQINKRAQYSSFLFQVEGRSVKNSKNVVIM